MKTKQITLFINALAILTLLNTPHLAFADSKDNLENVLTQYYKIEQSLSQDQISGIKENAELIASEATSIKDKKLAEGIQTNARALALSSGEAGTIKKAREDFKKLSQSLTEYLKKHPAKGWTIFYCPMKKSNWVQKAGTEAQNPFYGKEMSSCGTKVQ